MSRWYCCRQALRACAGPPPRSGEYALMREAHTRLRSHACGTSAPPRSTHTAASAMFRSSVAARLQHRVTNSPAGGALQESVPDRLISVDSSDNVSNSVIAPASVSTPAAWVLQVGSSARTHASTRSLTRRAQSDEQQQWRGIRPPQPTLRRVRATRLQFVQVVGHATRRGL
jgi:hypothetical protein